MCSCVDVLGIPHGKAFDQVDVDQHSRKASKLWHPDKGGSVLAFEFLMVCKTWLRNESIRREYLNQLAMFTRQKIAISAFNEIFQESQKDKKIYKGKSSNFQVETVEVRHLFLDSSGSMKEKHGKKIRIEVGKEVLEQIGDILELSPVNIHMIGSKSKLLYSQDDSVSLKDIESVWGSGGGGTFLWKYIYECMKDHINSEHEAIIITDGEDNHSDGEFAGLSGFNEVMKRLSGKLKISLFLIGNSLPQDSAKTLRDLCSASGGEFAQLLEGEAFSREHLVFFSRIGATHAERAKRSIASKTEYLQLADRGSAALFQWFLPPHAEQGQRRCRGSTCVHAV
jgi:hypothetical protein